MLVVTSAPQFTRPADTTAYASGDLVANNVTAGSVTALVFTFPTKGNAWVDQIRRVRIEKSSNNVTTASFRLHVYTSLPTVANGDNGVWLSTKSGYLGSIDVTVDKAFNDSAGPAVGYGANATGSEINLATLGGTGKNTLYGLLEARSAYTPTSAETFLVTMEVQLGDTQ